MLTVALMCIYLTQKRWYNREVLWWNSCSTNFWTPLSFNYSHWFI